MTHSSGETNRLIQDITELENKISELEEKLKEKETYHADCLRIKQLEQQLARYKEYWGNFKDILNDKIHVIDIKTQLRQLIKEFESEQND